MDTEKSRNGGRLGGWRAFPLKTLLAVTVLCLLLKENFPFSHFPMYSSFSDYSYYIYVADSKGDPLPIETLTGRRVGKLKKIYQRELNTAKESLKETGQFEGFRFMTREQRLPAGAYVLNWLEENIKPEDRKALEPYKPLQIYHVDLRGKGGGTVRGEPQLVGGGEEATAQ